MPLNAEEWEKDNVSTSSLDPQLSVARRTSSCNNCIGRTVSFCEGSFCDPVEIVMCDLKEQRTCLKFCFLLGKTPTESSEMLQEAFKEQALSCARVFEWFSHFKKGDLSNEDQPRSGHPSSSQNDENITKIREKVNEDRHHTIDELSEVTRVSWSSVQRILTQDLGMRLLQQNSSPACSDDQRNSRLTVCQDLEKGAWKWPKLLVLGHNSWRKLVLWLWPRKQVGIKPVEVSCFAPAQKNQTGEIECWSVSSTFKELCTGNSFPGVRWSTRSFTWGFWNDWGRGCGGQGQNCGDRVNGSFTMTMLLHTRHCEFVNFWPLMAWHLCPSPPTHLTWPPLTFFCFLEWKGTWKGADLTLWRTLSQLWQEHWTASKLRSSRDVSNSGNRDWTSAYHPTESTLKATNKFFVIF